MRLRKTMRIILTATLSLVTSSCGLTDQATVVDWVEASQGIHLRMSIPKSCPHSAAQPQPHDKIRASVQILKTSLVELSVPIDATADCPPLVLANPPSRKFIVVHIRPIFVGTDNPWTLDIQRRGWKGKFIGTPKETQYYLAGKVASGLLHYREMYCGPEEFDVSSPVLPEGWLRKSDGRPTRFPDDTAPPGCRDASIADIFASPPSTPPEKYHMLTCTREAPGAGDSGCHGESNLHGWSVVYSLRRSELAHHDEYRTAILQWLEQFIDQPPSDGA